MGDADTASIQKLIKQVIEATRCSPAQAELALYDNDNNIFAAVEYILDKGVDIESWTEHKSKKDKKKDEAERKVIRGHTSYRGRGAGVSDRGRRNSRTSYRGRGAGVSDRGRRNSAATDSIFENTAPLNREESVNVGSVQNIQPTSPQKLQTGGAWTGGTWTSQVKSGIKESLGINATTITTTNVSPAESKQFTLPGVEFATETDSQTASEWTNQLKSDPGINATTITTTDVSPVKSKQFTLPGEEFATETDSQTAGEWTNQLKSDLGINATTITATNVSPVKSKQLTLPGVEFATETASRGLTDYHFGFVEPAPAPPVPAAPVPTRAPSVESSSQSAESLFAAARHTSPVVAPVKTTEVHLGNGEYPVKANSPPAASTGISQNRLGFAETSSVSYNPSPTAVETRTQNVLKSNGHVATAQPQAHQQQQQQHQPQQQQAMFPSQMPFSYPNPYMYSPVTSNMRAEDYTALLQQYPFTMPGMDMTNMASLMGGVGFPQTTGSQSLSNQHRQDTHGMDNTVKFTAQSNREQTQQAPLVQPPPGFGSPFGMQPQMNMLQQHYNPQQYPHFMMANMGATGGRQMYAQDDERKSYDKMSGVKMQTAQPSPYHAGGHYGMSNNKKYNWNS